eukprot:6185701-Pleurochrysis_carterae.AAC.1
MALSFCGISDNQGSPFAPLQQRLCRLLRAHLGAPLDDDGVGQLERGQLVPAGHGCGALRRAK